MQEELKYFLKKVLIIFLFMLANNFAFKLILGNNFFNLGIVSIILSCLITSMILCIFTLFFKNKYHIYIFSIILLIFSVYSYLNLIFYDNCEAFISITNLAKFGQIKVIKLIDFLVFIPYIIFIIFQFSSKKNNEIKTRLVSTDLLYYERLKKISLVLKEIIVLFIIIYMYRLSLNLKVNDTKILTIFLRNDQSVEKITTLGIESYFISDIISVLDE